MTDLADRSGSITFRLLLLTVLTIPFENTIAFSGFTISRLLLVTTFVVGVIRVIRESRMRSFPLSLYLMGLFVLWVIATSLWSFNVGFTLNRAGQYIELVCMVWLIWEYARDSSGQQSLMLAYVVGCYVSISNTILSYAHGHSHYVLRYVASGFDPNDLGLTLALGIPIAWYIFSVTLSRIRLFLCGLYIPTAMFAIVLTASRGAAISTIVALSIVVWTYRGLTAKRRLFTVLVVFIALVCLVFLIPSSSWQRLGTIGSQINGGNLDERKYIWMAGLKVLLQHPILGIGAGAFIVGVTPYLMVPNVAHNVFLSVAVEEGLIGLLIFVALLASLAWRIRLAARGERAMLITLLITWVAGVSSLTWEYRKPTWFVFAIILSCYCHRSSSGFTGIGSYQRKSVANRLGDLDETL